MLIFELEIGISHYRNDITSSCHGRSDRSFSGTPNIGTRSFTRRSTIQFLLVRVLVRHRIDERPFSKEYKHMLVIGLRDGKIHNVHSNHLERPLYTS